MKKLILTLVVFTALMPLAKAQNARFGFTAGATLATYKTNVDNISATSNSKLGFSVGFTADIPMSSTFSFQPALQFLQKGGKESNGTFDLTTTMNYLELPLNFIYKAPGTGGHFLIGLGPSLAYGLGGTVSASSGGQSESTSLHFGGDGNLKAFEFGGNILTGYEWNSGFFVQLNYNMGFSNISPDSQSSFKNNYFGLRLGYFLKGKK